MADVETVEPPASDVGKWLTQKEAAAYLRISLNTLRARFPAAYVGRLPRYLKEDLDALMAERKEKVPRPKRKRLRSKTVSLTMKLTKTAASKLSA